MRLENNRKSIKLRGFVLEETKLTDFLLDWEKRNSIQSSEIKKDIITEAPEFFKSH